MITANPAHLELARRLLAQDASNAADPAAALVRTHQRLSKSLSPLVGAAGVQALFARSVKLSAVDHPSWAGLVSVVSMHGMPHDGASQSNLAEELRAYLQRQDAPSIEAVEALLAHFCALLAAFIGDRLTVQVLEEAWRAAPAHGPGERNS